VVVFREAGISGDASVQLTGAAGWKQGVQE